MKAFKKLLAKLLYKQLSDYFIDIMANKADEDAKAEAIKAGYTEKDWQDYYIDKEDNRMRDIADSVGQEAYQKGFEAGLRS